MLIDDSYANNCMTEVLLKQEGTFNQITKYSTPVEALSSISEDLPDLILLDINMPEMDGFNFLDEYIKLDSVVNSNYRPVVVMVSGEVFSENFFKIKKYKQYGVLNYLIKPIGKDDIEFLLNEHFNN